MKIDEQKAGVLAGQDVRGIVRDLMTKNGLGIDKLILRLKQATDATEIRVFKDKDDAIIYSKKLIAHSIRLDAVKYAFKLLDAEPSSKHEIDTGDIKINIVDYARNHDTV